MKMITLITLILFFPFFSSGQEKCKCPDNYDYNDINKKDFQYKTGKTISLCGFYETNNTYTEFVIFDCSNKKIIAEWGATTNCTLSFTNDTLYISELYSLPIGNGFSYKSTIIGVTKIYQNNNKIEKYSALNVQFPKYSKSQIKRALSLYSKFKPNYSVNSNLDSINVLADMLFCSYVSGSKEAEAELRKFEIKFAKYLDGALSESWHELWDIYINYKAQSEKSD